MRRASVVLRQGGFDDTLAAVVNPRRPVAHGAAGTTEGGQRHRFVGLHAQINFPYAQRQPHADQRIEQEERVAAPAVVHDGMPAHLQPAQPVVGHNHRTDHLERQKVKRKNVECPFADVVQTACQPSAPRVDAFRHVIAQPETSQGRQGKTDELHEIRRVAHRRAESERGQQEKGEAACRPLPVHRDEVPVLTVEEADAEKEYAHDVAITALGQPRHAQAAHDFPQRQQEGDGANGPPDLHIRLQPPHAPQQLEQHQVSQRGHQKGPEEPECAGQKLVIA